MELLLISEIGKGEFTNNLYEMKPDKYKTYIDFMNIISKDSSLTFDEKRCLIHKLCVYAMSPPVLSEDFINSLKSYKSLMHYFNGENHPKKRLKKALEFYTSGQDIKNESAIQLYDGNFLDILKNNNVTKYINDVWNKYRDTYDYLLTDNHLTIEEIKKKYYQDIENRIKVFDISACKINRDYCFDKQISNSFFIIKNCENLYNKNNFYIIGHTYDKDESIYVSKEISSKELNILIQESECIMIDLHEYDMEKCCPKYFSAGDKPIIVLINDYADCYQWFKETIKNDEIYIGDLYDKTVNNFFTVLFFSRRECTNTFFVFPTIKSLSKKLVEEFDLESELIFSSNSRFLSIISCLKNEVLMLKVCQWLLSFLTDSSGDFSSLTDSATKMNYDLIKTILNSSLHIKPQYYNQYLAALPTKKTKAQPFYALMEFENGKNTGKIKAETEEAFPILFLCKEHAIKYKQKYIKNENSNLTNYELIGMDLRYWVILKEYLYKSKKKIIICTDIEKSLVIFKELNQIDALIGMERNHSNMLLIFSALVK